MTGALPASSPAIRIHQGETIVCMAWSNTATSLWGLFRVVYDDGSEEDFILNRTLLVNNRIQGQITTGTIAHRNGYVVSGQICQVSGVANQATQRGQCFVRAMVVTDVGAGTAGVSSSGCRATLCTGYVYSGMDVPLGSFVEPGPAGGPGAIRSVTTTDPAAGLEVPDTFVPAGAIWLLRSFTVQLVQGLTQTPLPALEFESGAVVIALIPIMTTALGASTTAQLTWGIGLVQTSFVTVAGDEMYTAPLPVVYQSSISVIDTFATFTDGIGANTNYGPAVSVVEEWVMPN